MAEHNKESALFRQSLPSIGLSLEKNTPNVPADNQYHVLLNGDTLMSTPSKRRAMAEYARHRSRLVPETEPVQSAAARKRALLKMQADHDINALHAGSNIRPKLRVPSRRGHR